MQEAARVFSQWDRQAHLDSRGATLFFLWANEVSIRNIHETPWSFENPLQPPSGISNPTEALKALEKAVENAEEMYDALDAPWRVVARVKRDNLDLPVAVAPGSLGAFRVGWIDPDENGGFELTGGTTFVAAIEFDEEPIANGLLPYGNFTVLPPEFKSQWELFAAGELRPIYFSDEAVEAAVIVHEKLSRDLPPSDE